MRFVYLCRLFAQVPSLHLGWIGAADALCQQHGMQVIKITTMELTFEKKKSNFSNHSLFF